MSLLLYNIKNTISLNHQIYIFNINHNNKKYIYISTSNNSYNNSYPFKKHKSNIFFTSPSKLYITIKKKNIKHKFNYIYKTHNSIKQQQTIPLNITYKQNNTPQKNQKKKLTLNKSYIL